MKTYKELLNENNILLIMFSIQQQRLAQLISYLRSIGMSTNDIDQLIDLEEVYLEYSL